MVFITVGSQKFQFNRLLIEIDKLAASNCFSDDVFAQIGYCDYKPQNFKYINFLNQDKFVSMLTNCTVIITHGGTGAIIGAVRNGKKVIAVPRLKKFGEHVDDHQIQVVSTFEKMNIISACYEIENLGEVYLNLSNKIFTPYQSNTENIIKDIVEFIECNQRKKENNAN